jgi:hypothetical protein
MTPIATEIPETSGALDRHPMTAHEAAFAQLECLVEGMARQLDALRYGIALARATVAAELDALRADTDETAVDVPNAPLGAGQTFDD